MRGYILPLRCWIVERFCAWTTCFLRPVCHNAELPATVAGLRPVVLACLLLHQWMSFSSLSVMECDGVPNGL